MKCKNIFYPLFVGFAFLLGMLVNMSCSESLPGYVFPEHVMSFNVTLAQQLSIRVAPPGKQSVQLIFEAQNNFTDVFYDSARIKGSVRIWWKRKPKRFTTLYLSAANLTNPTLIQNGKLLLIPGQKFTMSLFWDLMSSDSIYLPYEMSYTYATLKRVCNYRVVCSDPEEFVVEASLNVYDKIGYLTAPPVEFTFVGQLCRGCGGPYCTPPGGCGGS